MQARAGDGTNGVTAQIAGLSVNTWYFFVVTFTDADKKLRVYINNGTPNVSSALPGSVVVTPSTLMLGDARSTTTNWNGQIDEVGLWSRVLTAQELTDLFNSGAGLFYGDVA